MNVKALALSYNCLASKAQLNSMLSLFLGGIACEGLTKYEIAKKINDIIIKNHEGEEKLKYLLAKAFIKKNYIAAFEVRAKNSRTDFLAINGFTKSFEIKSKIDTLNRLKKQIDDYGTVFEYNTVVIDEIHLERVLNLLPDFYGIWYYSASRKIEYRAPMYSPKLNSTEQISLLNKNELLKIFGTADKAEVVANIQPKEINTAFKIALKQRYEKRWRFVQLNFENILPIDFQFFFNTNLPPTLVYESYIKH